MMPEMIPEMDLEVMQSFKLALLLQAHTMISPKITTPKFAVKTSLLLLEVTLCTQLIHQHLILIAILQTVPDGA